MDSVASSACPFALRVNLQLLLDKDANGHDVLVPLDSIAWAKDGDSLVLEEVNAVRGAFTAAQQQANEKAADFYAPITVQYQSVLERKFVELKVQAS